MAGRESQGLQIAVIIFALLTIGLGISTGIYFTEAQTAKKERADAVTAQGATQAENNKLLFRIRAYQYVLGVGELTPQDLENIKSSAGDDAEVAGVLDNYAKDMATYVPEQGQPATPNYRTLPAYFLAALAKKNVSVVDANDLTRQAEAKQTADFTAQSNRAKAAEDATTVARNDLAAAKTAFDEERSRTLADKDVLAKQIAASTARSKAEYDKLATERDAQVHVNTTLQQAVTSQKERIAKLQSEQADLFENPDGKITWVNQRQQLVWLNLGRSDGLLRQTTFSVYDHDENGVANAEPKGRLEVMRIVGDHLAEARILEDKPANPILPGDVVHTPSWSPGQRIHFAIAGKIDVNNDGVSDFDLLKNIILVNGGVIDAELSEDGKPSGTITVGTRYLILGAPPDEKSSENALSEFRNITQKATQTGTATIDVPKFLEMMGWKPEERTVELAGSAGTGEFRKRGVGTKAPAGGKTTPAAGADPAEAPAAGTPAPMPAGGTDPFAGGADPFGAPAPPAKTAPMPAAGAEADPFAP